MVSCLPVHAFIPTGLVRPPVGAQASTSSGAPARLPNQTVPPLPLQTLGRRFSVSSDSCCLPAQSPLKQQPLSWSISVL